MFTLAGIFHGDIDRGAQLSAVSAQPDRLGKAPIAASGAVAGSQKSERESRCSTRQTNTTGKAPAGEKATKPDSMAALVGCPAASLLSLGDALYALWPNDLHSVAAGQRPQSPLRQDR
ncbi:MAG TPA: hypothetical protein DCE28_06000 [Halomonas sp.]|nr:hypothetical protein [Halomonas sp.]